MAKLTVHIGAKVKEFTKGLQGMKTKFDRFGKSLTRTASTFATGIGAALAGGFAMAARSAINHGDDIAKTAKRIGISAEEYQKLTFAIRRSGGANEDAEKQYRRMAAIIDDLKNGLSTAVRSFKDMGLSYDDLKNKSPEQQFDTIVDALNKVQDASTRVALAQDVFGRSGTRLLPLLADYRELKQEAEELGAVISNDAIRAAEEFKDATENLKTALMATVANSGVVEWLKDIATAAAEASAAMRQLDQGNFMDGEQINIAAPTAAEIAEGIRQVANGGLAQNPGKGFESFTAVGALENTGATIGLASAAPTAKEKEAAKKAIAAAKAKPSTEAEMPELAGLAHQIALDMADVALGMNERIGAAMAEAGVADADANLVDLRKQAANLSRSLTGGGGGGVIASNLNRIGAGRGRIIDPQIKGAQKNLLELQKLNQKIEKAEATREAANLLLQDIRDKLDLAERFA